jgi:hypothetical protein
VEYDSTGLVPELGIPYENGGIVALSVRGVVATTKDGFGPLCEVVVVKTMVAQTDDSRLGDDSPMVTTVVGIEEFPEKVTAFVSITV